MRDQDGSWITLISIMMELILEFGTMVVFLQLVRIVTMWHIQPGRSKEQLI